MRMPRTFSFFAVTAAVTATMAASVAVAARPLQAQDAGDETPGVIEGTVTSRFASRSAPLSWVWVEVVDSGPSLAAITDSAGAYRLPSVPAGLRRIRIHRLGSRSLQVRVRVPAGDTVRLDAELEWAPLPVSGVTVRADPMDARLLSGGASADAAPRIHVRALEAGPGLAEAGLGAAARSLAEQGTGDPARVLLMRGSTVDEKLVLLDGAPIYAPFHLGGLVRSFDSDLLASARHYIGGSPARYDGGLSYVLDLATRSGSDDRFQGSASLDLVSGAATLEGPLGDATTILASGRGLHEAASPLLGAEDLPFGYGEILVRADVRPGPNHRIAAMGFWNREDVRLSLDPPATYESGVLAQTELRLRRPESARWGNGAASLRYLGDWDRTGVEVTLAGSRYRALLPLGWENPALGRARTDRVRAAAELRRETGQWALRVGASAEGIDHASAARAVVGDSLREVSHSDRTGSLSVHVEGSRPLGDELRFRGGLRTDYFPDAGGARLAPRASLAWSLTGQAVVTIAAGRFYQLPRGGELEVRMALDDPGGVDAGREIYPPAEATHFVLSLDQGLSPTLDLGLDGFFKGFRNLPGSDSDVLRSSGMDVRVVREGAEVSGWLGYSLAWFWEPHAVGSGRTTEFAGRHLVTTGVQGRIPPGIGAEARLSYGDGLPYTSLPVVEQTDGPPESEAPVPITNDLAGPDARRRIPTLDGFLRIELELHADWEIGSEQRPTRLRPYLRLLNAVSRRDALFYYFEPWRSDELRALAERPVLPVLGVEITF